MAREYVAANQEIIDAQNGASLKEFAREGFLAAPSSTRVKFNALQDDANHADCAPGDFLITVIDQGHELQAEGAGGALTKGLLLAQASNAIFWGPGGESTIYGDDLSGVTGEPSGKDVLADLAELQADQLETCAELAETDLLLLQAQVDFVAALSPEQAFGPSPDLEPPEELAPITREVEMRHKALECSELRMARLTLPKIENVVAIGFLANSTKAEFVKSTWLAVEDKIIDIDAEMALATHPVRPRPGTTVDLTVTVINTGNVPIFGLRLSELTSEIADDPSLSPSTVLEPGDSVEATASFVAPTLGSNKFELSIQLDAETPFGRVFGTSESVMITMKK